MSAGSFLTSQGRGVRTQPAEGKRVAHSMQPCLGGRISAEQDVTPRIASGEQREMAQVMQGEDFLSSGHIGDQRESSNCLV